MEGWTYLHKYPLQVFELRETDNILFLDNMIIKRSMRNKGHGSNLIEELKQQCRDENKILVVKLGVPAWKLRKWCYRRGLFSMTDPEGFECFYFVPAIHKAMCHICNTPMTKGIRIADKEMIFYCKSHSNWIWGSEYVLRKLIYNDTRQETP